VLAGQILGLNGSSGPPTACDSFILDSRGGLSAREVYAALSY
jgi:hypothetical protein